LAFACIVKHTKTAFFFCRQSTLNMRYYWVIWSGNILRQWKACLNWDEGNIRSTDVKVIRLPLLTTHL